MTPEAQRATVTAAAPQQAKRGRGRPPMPAALQARPRTVRLTDAQWVDALYLGPERLRHLVPQAAAALRLAHAEHRAHMPLTVTLPAPATRARHHPKHRHPLPLPSGAPATPATSPGHPAAPSTPIPPAAIPELAEAVAAAPARTAAARRAGTAAAVAAVATLDPIAKAAGLPAYSAILRALERCDAAYRALVAHGHLPANLGALREAHHVLAGTRVR